MSRSPMAVETLRAYRSEFFKNKHERNAVIRQAADVAAEILHIHSDLMPQDALVKLAGDVGHKLRDFVVTKKVLNSVLYYTCQQSLDSVELATIVAFRSQFPCFHLDTDFGLVQINISKTRPLGCDNLDSYVSCRLRNLGKSPYHDATAFRNDSPKVLYWGTSYHIFPSVERFLMSADTFINELHDEDEDDEEGDRINAESVINEVVKQHNDNIHELVADFVNENIVLPGKENRSLLNEFIFDEADQINIYCPICDYAGANAGANAEVVLICTLEQLKRHCLERDHDFSKAIRDLVPSADILYARAITNSEAKLVPLPSCSDCPVLADWWDAVYLHNFERHGGDLATKLRGIQLLAYLVWAGAQKPLTCSYCRESDGSITTFLTPTVMMRHKAHAHGVDEYDSE